MLSALETGLRALGGLLLAALLVPVSIQVFSRLMPGIDSPEWTEEAARFLLIWTIMIGSMVALRRGSHFAVDMLPRLQPGVALVLDIVTHAIVLVFAAFLLRHGVDFALFARHQTSEIADWPLWIVYVAWPVTGAVWCLFTVEALWRRWRHRKELRA